MAIQTIVKDPERIRNLTELEDILARINAYEKERNCSSGVLLIQNMQLGSIYMIESVEEAKKELSKPILSEPRTCEWGMKFYPKPYFEEMRKRFEI